MIITKSSLLILILALAIVGKGLGQSFQLTGTSPSNEGKWIYLYYTNINQQNQIDSVQIKNDQFVFTGKIDGPSMVYVGLKGKNGRLTEQDSYRFFLEPQKKIKLRQVGKHLNKSLVEGSKTQEEYQSLRDRKEKVEERWRVVMDTLRAVNERSNVQYQELKDWVLLPYFAEIEDLDTHFFSAHPKSAATAYMLRFYTSKMGIDTLQKYYDALGTELQQSSNGRSLAKKMANIRKGSVGSIAMDFTAVELNGQKLQLAAFKGKYVLLDFWASWCVPCRKSNPHLKKLYHRYHDQGLEVIGVSDDDGKRDKWEAAVQKDGVDIWHNVLRGYDSRIKPGEENPKDISTKFGVQVLPTKILIDPNGVIIGKYRGDETGLDEALHTAFSKK